MCSTSSLVRLMAVIIRGNFRNLPLLLWKHFSPGPGIPDQVIRNMRGPVGLIMQSVEEIPFVRHAGPVQLLLKSAGHAQVRVAAAGIHINSRALVSRDALQ